MTAFIDSNVIVYYITGAGGEMAERSLTLMKQLEDGEVELATSELVVAEVVWLLQRRTKMSRAQISDAVLPLIKLPNFRVPNKSLWTNVFEVFCSTTVDFTDAYNAAAMFKSSISQIYSYDRDFDRITGISRITP